jgi:hypothetical protein
MSLQEYLFKEWVTGVFTRIEWGTVVETHKIVKYPGMRMSDDTIRGTQPTQTLAIPLKIV